MSETIEDYRRDKPIPPEAGRMAANSEEFQNIKMLAVCHATLQDGVSRLRARAQTIPHGWRQLRLAYTTLDRVLVDIYDTIPFKQLKTLLNTTKSGRIEIRYAGPALGPGQALIAADDMALIAETAVKAECGMCLKTAGEIKGCKLRRALISAAPPTDNPAGGCGYRDIAIKLINGEGIT